MEKNVIGAQSGGPSPVINASLQGVIEGCLAYPDHIDHIYAGWHGIEGVLLEELIDLSQQPEKEIGLLRWKWWRITPDSFHLPGLHRTGLM